MLQLAPLRHGAADERHVHPARGAHAAGWRGQRVGALQRGVRRDMCWLRRVHRGLDVAARASWREVARSVVSAAIRGGGLDVAARARSEAGARSVVKRCDAVVRGGEEGGGGGGGWRRRKKGGALGGDSDSDTARERRREGDVRGRRFLDSYSSTNKNVVTYTSAIRSE
jgi:hypothetical protein